MDSSDTARARKSRLISAMIRGAFLYVLAPALLLFFLAQPISNAVRASDANVFLILLAALAAVILNWMIYAVLRRKRPSLPVFAHGALCLLIIEIMEHYSLPANHPLTSTLAVIGGCLALAWMLLLSFWLAALPSRPAHVIAVGFRIIVGLTLFFMAYQVIRDFESRRVSRDTWITIGVMIATVLGRCSSRILSAFRTRSLRRRASGLAAGTIVQIIGETRLDRDDDLVTRYLVRIQYTVNDSLYEIRTGIARFIMRRYGRDTFVGREVPVFYDPSDPACAFTIRIDQHVLEEPSEPDSEEKQ